MSRWRTVSVLLAGALVAAATSVGYLIGTGANGPGARSSRTWLPDGAGAPQVWLDIPVPEVEFRTAAGGTARLSEYRGQIVLLNFWGSWCPPCRVEIPHLIEVQEALAELGGTIIGPAVDSGSGTDVLRFASEYGINYPVWLSDYETAVGRFGAGGYPFSLLIDRRGVIRKQYLGPQTANTLLRDIEALIDTEPENGDEERVTGASADHGSAGSNAGGGPP